MSTEMQAMRFNSPVFDFSVRLSGFHTDDVGRKVMLCQWEQGGLFMGK